MGTEYAVQRRTFVDGEFDRTQTENPLTHKPHTLESAQEEARHWNTSTYYPRALVRARVVQREVTEWVEAQA